MFYIITAVVMFGAGYWFGQSKNRKKVKDIISSIED